MIGTWKEIWWNSKKCILQAPCDFGKIKEITTPENHERD